ncbi:fibronectin type III domain-containing protein, partial [Lentimicrobium sp.]|uniref:fibronectin type III domain-containing protein n=1 Tax=Lentimicrobium sp. TaxID=2034841 RepID=UPI002C28B536
MRKLFTLLIVLFLWAGSSWGQVDVQIGSGTTTTTYLPIYSCYNYSYSQQIYLGSELQNAGGGVGTINKIRFYYASGGTTFANWSDWTVYLGNTTKTVFANTTDWEPYENLTQVFTGTITPVTGSWVEITLTTPYNYTGGNLIVAVDENSPNYSCTASWRSFASGSNRGILYYSDGTNPDPASPPAANYGPNASISQIQFNMAAYVPTTPPNCATLVSPADAATNVPVGATLNWASGGGAPTGYKLYFGAGSLPGTPVDLGLVTTYDPAGDMDYSTTYYWKVVPYNDNGDATDCATWSFTTGPDPTVTVFPFTEGFEGATFPPYGWSQITVSGTSPWIMSTTSPHSGLQCARAPWASAGGEHLLITPPLDLTTVDYRLKFWLKGSSSAGTDLEVQIATNNSSASNFTTTLATYIAGTNMPTVWTEQIIDLSAYEDIQYIAFRLIDDDGYAFYIDDVTIEEIPATPVFSVSPSTKDFGTLAVGGSLSQVFTISNTGGGTLVINPAISVTGTDADQFVLTDANTYPLNLTAGQTATVSVAFTPTSAGEKSASLVIIDNLGSKATNTVPLTGTGFTPPPGSTCDNPYPIDLPLESFAGNTATMGDDYSSTWITPNSNYMNGDDMVFEFTLTEAGYLSGSMTSPDTWIGLFILEDCPDPVTPAAVIRSATSTGSSVSFTDQLMQAGTYFAIVSSYPSPQSIAFTLNLAFEPLPDCPTPTALTATPASFSAELGWTENGTATLWDIEWGEAGFTPGEGTVITGVSNPYTLTGLEFSTPYDFYVRADCGEGSVSDWSVVKNFSTLAACPAPSVLTATSITATSAVLGWTENGSATSWDIEYGQTPFTPTGTPTISGVTNPYALTGLSSGITYAYYVRAYCDETYQSTWSGPLTFTTQTVVPAPYTEGFITTSTPTGWTTTGWSIGSVRGATGNPGNNIYRNLWSSATTGTFTTVNVGPVASGMSLTFDYQLTNYDSPYDPPAEGSGNFIVSVSTDFGLNYTELETTDNDGEAGWRSKSYDLSAYAGSNIKVRIVGNRTSGDYDLAFDNFYIGLPITCPAPTDVIATAVTQTSATISWTAPDPAPANGYEYEVRNDGDPGSGATGLAASGTTAAGVTSADITGLEDGTDYMIYVRSVCGTENYSNWAEGSFFTPCDVIIAPFIETVEEGELSPCWTIGTSGDGSWFLSSAASGYGIGLQSFIAPFYAISDPSPFDLYTPEFDASALVNPQLEFDFAYATYTGGEVDQLDVLYSTDGGANYSLLLSMPGGEDGILNTGGVLSGSFVPTATEWETQVLALPAGTNKIAFRATSDWGN